MSKEIVRGLRFSKRIPLIQGIWLNVSKASASISMGVPGMSCNVDPNGKIRLTVGIPGTGLSITRHLDTLLG